MGSLSVCRSVPIHDSALDFVVEFGVRLESRNRIFVIQKCAVTVIDSPYRRDNRISLAYAVLSHDGQAGKTGADAYYRRRDRQSYRPRAFRRGG